MGIKSNTADVTAAPLTGRRRAVVLRGPAGVAVADVIDADDPEAEGAVRVEGQLHVVKVPGDPPHPRPAPPTLLGVLLLPHLHQEL